jgi:hypothetical protein
MAAHWSDGLGGPSYLIVARGTRVFVVLDPDLASSEHVAPRALHRAPVSRHAK